MVVSQSSLVVFERPRARNATTYDTSVEIIILFDDFYFSFSLTVTVEVPGILGRHVVVVGIQCLLGFRNGTAPLSIEPLPVVAYYIRVGGRTKQSLQVAGGEDTTSRHQSK